MDNDIENIIESIKSGLKKGADAVSEEFEKSQILGKYKDSEDVVADILDDAGKAVSSVVDKIADKTEPVIKKTKAQIYERFYEEYKKAGAPYGDTHEGFLQWTDERETAIRNSVDDGLEKGRSAILKGVEKAKGFVDNEIGKHEKASDTVVDSMPEEVNISHSEDDSAADEEK